MQALPDPNQLLSGGFAFIRITALLFALPVTGDPPTPVRSRILLALAITFAIYGTLPKVWSPDITAEFLELCAFALREVLIGLTVGYVGRLAFDGLVMAASVVAYQMGFGTASLFMPDYSTQMDSYTALHRMIIMLLFLTLGLYQVFLSAISESFNLIGGGTAHLSPQFATIIIELTSGIFLIALKLSAPVLLALLFTTAALGLVARTVPKMNAFIMSFPISFGVGLVIYIATIPLFSGWLNDHFLSVESNIFATIKALTQ